MVGRGGLEPPTSALALPKQHGVEYTTVDDVAGRYQA